ncbi:hypothetical protein [Pseudomonas syringae]|uniref:hypothetical protein n=1 Tax=Pseudomonas syringae TaxID=317 RepID=UPI001F284556|nr:hypothetical protein [Pseudomonas syringae]MCF5371916.1 hypothetical protein [Pseudomonas syringae]MCF5382492.1 hypothetical protein [Pseudomonas syringae]MCF5419379.1 hypothetical protein [Pseudomonas syringae]MCF5451926.1 hypothetical protein [Pseudomonas syringae]MCF5460269.1 hypothetical protein [Pseudomonas syringae]
MQQPLNAVPLTTTSEACFKYSSFIPKSGILVLGLMSISVLLGLLSGCDKKVDVMAQPDMAVAAGYIRFDSGKLVQVIGYDRCPAQGYAFIGRVESRAMEKHCTIVSRNSDSFDISIGTTKGMIVERWSVLADARSIKLVRPDGDGATVFKLAD